MERSEYQPQAAFFQAAGSSATLAGSLALLAASYLLLVAAPAVSQSFHLLSGSLVRPAELASWVPTAAGAGLAVGGAAGFVFVLERLLRNLRHHPYACIAPTLAVFSGALLVSLGAKLPLPGGTQVLGVFALFLSVLGGALIEQSRHLVLGLSLALFPSLCLLGACFSLSPHRTLSGAIWGLEPSGRLFLAILGLTGAACALLGSFVRAAAPASVAGAESVAPMAPKPAVRTAGREDTLELWLHQAEGQLKRRAIPGWLWFSALPVLVGLALLTRDRWTGAAQVRSSALTASPIEEPSQVRTLIEARSASAQEQDNRPYALAPLVEQLVAAPAQNHDALQVELALLAPAQAVEVVSILAEPAVHVSEQAQPAARGPSPADLPAQLAAKAKSTKVKPAAKAKVAVKAHTRLAARIEGRGGAGEQNTTVAPADVHIARELKGDAKQAEARGLEREPAPEARQAAREPAPEAPVAAKAQAPTRSDDSLDDLMDRVVPKGKQAKAASVSAQEDPIYGL